MVRMRPVVAVVDEDTLNALAPVVKRTEEFLATHPEWSERCARNGWSAEALAYGQLLSLGACDQAEAS